MKILFRNREIRNRISGLVLRVRGFEGRGHGLNHDAQDFGITRMETGGRKSLYELPCYILKQLWTSDHDTGHNFGEFMLQFYIFGSK